jgi:hypothetical protein
MIIGRHRKRQNVRPPAGAGADEAEGQITPRTGMKTSLEARGRTARPRPARPGRGRDAAAGRRPAESWPRRVSTPVPMGPSKSVRLASSERQHPRRPPGGPEIRHEKQPQETETGWAQSTPLVLTLFPALSQFQVSDCPRRPVGHPAGQAGTSPRAPCTSGPAASGFRFVTAAFDARRKPPQVEHRPRRPLARSLAEGRFRRPRRLASFTDQRAPGAPGSRR